MQNVTKFENEEDQTVNLATEKYVYYIYFIIEIQGTTNTNKISIFQSSLSFSKN